MQVIFDFHGDFHRRRLLLIAASNLNLLVDSKGSADPWIFAVNVETAEDAYRLGLEHGRVMIEQEGKQHANADTH
jgi:hypothetical protein